MLPALSLAGLFAKFSIGPGPFPPAQAPVACAFLSRSAWSPGVATFARLSESAPAVSTGVCGRRSVFDQRGLPELPAIQREAVELDDFDADALDW